MDAAYISAFAALAGSAIGGLTSFATSWTTQHSQARAQRLAAEREARAALFGRFLDEAAKLYSDALQNKRDDITATGRHLCTDKPNTPYVIATGCGGRRLCVSHHCRGISFAEHYNGGNAGELGRKTRRSATRFQRGVSARAADIWTVLNLARRSALTSLLCRYRCKAALSTSERFVSAVSFVFTSLGCQLSRPRADLAQRPTASLIASASA